MTDAELIEQLRNGYEGEGIGAEYVRLPDFAADRIEALVAEVDAARLEASNAWRLLNGSADANQVAAAAALTAVVEVGARAEAAEKRADDIAAELEVQIGNCQYCYAERILTDKERERAEGLAAQVHTLREALLRGKDALIRLESDGAAIRGPSLTCWCTGTWAATDLPDHSPDCDFARSAYAAIRAALAATPKVTPERRQASEVAPRTPQAGQPEVLPGVTPEGPAPTESPRLRLVATDYIATLIQERDTERQARREAEHRAAEFSQDSDRAEAALAAAEDTIRRMAPVVEALREELESAGDGLEYFLAYLETPEAFDKHELTLGVRKRSLRLRAALAEQAPTQGPAVNPDSRTAPGEQASHGGGVAPREISGTSGGGFTLFAALREAINQYSAGGQAATVTSPGTHLERARKWVRKAKKDEITVRRLYPDGTPDLVASLAAEFTSIERAAFERAAGIAHGVLTEASNKDWGWDETAAKMRGALRAAAGAPEEP